MSRWLSTMHNLLEKLDDQVENVREALTEHQDSEEDDEEYDTSGDDDDEEEEDEDEEEVDLIAEEEGPKQALFSPGHPEEVAPIETTSKPPEDYTKPVLEQTSPAPQQPKPSTTPAPLPELNPTAAVSSLPTSATHSGKGEMSGPRPASPIAKPSLQIERAPPPPEAISTSATGTEKSTEQAPLSGTVLKGPERKSVAPSVQQETLSASAPPRGHPQPAPPKPPPTRSARPPASAGGVNSNNKQEVLAEMDRLRRQVVSLEQDLASAKTEIKDQQKEFTNITQSKQQLLAEMKPMRKQIATLQQELMAANKEIKAQQKELNSAATIIERERQELKEEKEDLQEEHEEEIDSLKLEYETKFANLKTKHKEQLDDMRQQLSQEKAERQQEGGDLNQGLGDALQRERNALQELANLRQEKAALESEVQHLSSQQHVLQEKFETAMASQMASVQRQQQAEIALDEALEQHKRQLKQRQVREAELEQTIAEMGAALTTSSSAAAAKGTASTTNIAQSDKMEMSYKERWEVAMEDVETLNGQLKLETQRCEALRRELDEINQERSQEATAYQENHRQYHQKLEEQASTISRLESIVCDLQQDQDFVTNDGDSSAVAVQRLQRQLDESTGQIKRLSELLLRQQGMTDGYKAETLALKGRLQAAIARADEAEKAAFQSTVDNGNPRSYEAEGGNLGFPAYKMRHRIKGRGGVGAGRKKVRSIRTTLNIGPGSSMEGLGKTIDALDSWMIETGAIMRQEPLARLGFFLYLCILHLWCFCLVSFHVIEPCSAGGRTHGDFPSSLRGAAANVSHGQ